MHRHRVPQHVLIALGSNQDQFGARVAPTLVQALGEEGIAAEAYGTGLQVVSSLWPGGDDSERQPSLMVLSALLPGYNGLSILAGIRSLGWRTPVILTWPPQHQWIREEAERLNCLAVVREPVDPMAMKSLILEAMPLLARRGRRVAPMS